MRLRKTIFAVITLLMATSYGAQLVDAAPRERKIPGRTGVGLQITSPQNNARVQSPLTVSGTATQNGKITVNVKATFTGGEQDLGTFQTNLTAKNQWQTVPINLWAPEDAKNLRYVITAAQPGVRGAAQSSKVTVLPPQKVVLVPRDQLNQNRFERLNPGVILPPRNPVPKPGPIDPITGRPRNSGGSNTSASTATRITSPSRNNSNVQIPLTIAGTAEKNSNVKIEILTTYKKYGETIAERKVIHSTTDNSGKWPAVKIFSIDVDEADDRVTHKIDAFRVEGDVKKGNTATITVFSNPKKKSPITFIVPTVDVVANKKHEVRGRAVPGSKIQVRVTVEGVNSRGHADAGGVSLVKDWQTATAGSNGVWRVPAFNFDSKGRVRNIKFHITAREENNSRNSQKITVVGR